MHLKCLVFIFAKCLPNNVLLNDIQNNQVRKLCVVSLIVYIRRIRQFRNQIRNEATQQAVEQTAVKYRRRRKRLEVVLLFRPPLGRY